MFKVRRSEERGHFDHGWLNTFHTFSFADYYDKEWMGFRSLRVINEDVVQPGEGFDTHGHRDMEILTYIISGALEHKDSMGNGSVIRPGEIQYMSAGSGVTHSEFNHSKTEPVHLMQIWILPLVAKATPRYDQKQFAPNKLKNKWCLLASQNGEDGSIAIRQDARLFASHLNINEQLGYTFAERRTGFLHVIKGNIRVGDITLKNGDALMIQKEKEFYAMAESASELLFFDLD